jgi:peptide/nickel transport system substrate-binding protein
MVTFVAGYWPTKPVRGGYLRRAHPVYIGLMNPNHWPVNDWASISYFYEGRMSYDGNYKQRNPYIVEGWEFVNPHTLLEIYKRGITFHDGTPLTAHSMKYLVDWINDKKNGCWSRGLQARIKKVEVVDDYTLKWSMKEPWGTYPVGMMGFFISEKALKGDVAIREAKTLAGKVKRAKKKVAKLQKKAKKAEAKGAETAAKTKSKLDKAKKALGKLEAQYANPDWWFGKSVGHPDMPYLDGIKVTIIPDPAIRLANLRAGKIDTMGISKSQYRMIKNDPNLYVHTFLDNYTSFLFFNHVKGPCKDPRIRKALSHAIDRRALIAGTQFGLARPASCFLPGDHWAHNPNLEPVPYDPELTRRLLKEAGFAKGLTIRGTSFSTQDANTVAVAVKSMLSDVGIDWKVESLEPAAISDRHKNLEFDMSLTGQPYIQDPDPTFTGRYHPQGGHHFGRTDNKEVFTLIEKARHEFDEAKRQPIYWEIEKKLYGEYADAWLWWNVAVVVYRKNVQGWNNEMWIKYRTAFSRTHPLWFKDGHP